MKWVKRGVITLVLVVLLLVGALVAAVLYIDPNDYKDQITELVAEQTGRTLNIEGDIKLSIFPWIGLELGQVSLDNPGGFTDKHFFSMERLNVKAAILPLFKLQVRVGEIELLGLRVNAERRADGMTNWQDLLADSAQAEVEPAPATERAAEPEAEQLTEPEGDSESAPPPIKDFYLGGINIDNANFIWRDVTTSTVAKVEHLDIKTGAVQLNKPTRFTVEFALRNEEPKLIAGVELGGELHADLESAVFSLQQLGVQAKASGPMLPGYDQELKLAVSALSVDMATEALQLDGLVLSAMNAELKTSLQAKNILSEQPEANGQLQVQIASLRNLMGRLEIPAPITAEPKVLGAMTMQATYKAGMDSVAVEGIELNIDNSKLTGQLSAKNFAKPAIRFELAVDRVNADEYLPPVPEGVEAEETAASEVAAESENVAEAVDTEIKLPVELIKELDIKGSFKLGALQVMNVNVSNFNTTVEANSGVVALNPIELDLYQGGFKGQAGLDVNKKLPVYGLKFDLSGVESGPLIEDYMQQRLIEGLMNAEANIKTQGVRVSQLLEKLNGSFSVAFKDGALSVDVRQKLRDAKNKLKNLVRINKTESRPVGEPSKFSSITASGKIVNGIVKNKDLEVRARHFYVKGKGELTLPTNYINYVLTLLLSKDGAGQDEVLGELIDLPIDMKLKGKVDELDYTKILIKALGSAIKNRAKRAIDQKKAELKAKLDAQKQRQELKRQKEAEIARQKAELERKKKEAEEQLKRELEQKKKEEKEKLLRKLFN